MANADKIIGTSIEEGEDTRRQLGANDNEPGVIIEVPTHLASIKQTRVQITQTDIGSQWLIWGDVTRGIWMQTWQSDEGLGSPQYLQVVNYNDTWEEVFENIRFKSGSTTAEWTDTGSVTFPTGSEIIYTLPIFMERLRNVSEVYIKPQYTLGSFKYEVETFTGSAWQEIPENELTILNTQGSFLNLRISEPTGTALRHQYLFENSVKDVKNNLTGIGSRVAAVPYTWYYLDELDSDLGSSVTDYSGSSVTGSAYDVIKGIKGKKGYCYEFDGESSYVQSDDTFDTISGSQARTICAWLKSEPGVGSIQTIVNWGGAVAGSDMIFTINATGSLEANINNGSIVGNSNLNNSGWHHVAYVHDGGSDIISGSLFVNGTIETLSGSVSNTMNTLVGSSLYLGALHGASNYFDGYIDDVRVYGEALTATEIYQIYHNPLKQERPLKSSLAYTENGKVGSAALFTGEDYVVLTGSDFRWEEASYACWFKADTISANQSLINNYYDDYNGWGLQILDTGSLIIKNDIGSTNETFYHTAIEAGSWYHVTGMIDNAGSQTLYVNGSLIESGSVATSGSRLLNLSGSANIFIGEEGNHYQNDTLQYGFTGSIDDVRLYRKILTGSEVEEIYNSGSGTIDDITESQVGSATISRLDVRYTIIDQPSIYIVDHTDAYLIDDLGNYIIATRI